MTTPKSDYITRDFTKEELDDLEVRFGGSAVVRDDIVDTTRWGIVHKVVFRFAGDLWEISFEEGATEYQEQDPFEYGPHTARRVEARRVEVTEYHPVIRKD